MTACRSAVAADRRPRDAAAGETAVMVADRLSGAALDGIDAFLGAALLAGELDLMRPGDGWDGRAHNCLAACEDPAIAEALRAVLTAFVAMCRDRGGEPGWFTPVDVMWPESPMARRFPRGAYNCGLAHGIPGPLALLSIAEAAGFSVPHRRGDPAPVAGPGDRCQPGHLPRCRRAAADRAAIRPRHRRKPRVRLLRCSPRRPEHRWPGTAFSCCRERFVSGAEKPAAIPAIGLADGPYAPAAGGGISRRGR